MKKKYIFGSWKMYLDLDESVKVAQELKKIQSKDSVEIVVFPSSLSFVSVKKELQDSGIKVGVQNVAWVPKGAYTGEVSALLFKNAGAEYTLVGHSERRYLFGETNEDIKKKIQACLDVGLKVILCIGETQEDRDNGKMGYKLKKELSVLEGLDLTDDFFVGYEPVWAISKAGVGIPCLPVDADDALGLIKEEVKKYTSKEVGLIYGGSVDDQNVLSYLSLEVCDGVLVGSASSKVDKFSNLIKKVSEVY